MRNCQGSDVFQSKSSARCAYVHCRGARDVSIRFVLDETFLAIFGFGHYPERPFLSDFIAMHTVRAVCASSRNFVADEVEKPVQFRWKKVGKTRAKKVAKRLPKVVHNMYTFCTTPPNTPPLPPRCTPHIL